MPEGLVTESTILLDDLHGMVRESTPPVYAVFDACDEPLVPAKANILGDRAVSLYRGRAEQDYWAIAPYLAVVDEELVDWIAENLGSDPWGIFLTADADLDTLRRHLRRFLMVKTPEGKQVYFRFYDPRPLPVFLGTCSDTQLDQLFDPVQSFIAQGDDQQLIRYSRTTPASSSPAPFQFFRIRQPQMDALAAYMEQGFYRRSVNHVRKQYPEETAAWSDEEALDFAARKTTEARSHQIEYEADIQRYMGLCVGHEILKQDPQPKWALEILRYPNRPAERKLDLLEQTLARAVSEAEAS